MVVHSVGCTYYHAQQTRLKFLIHILGVGEREASAIVLEVSLLFTTFVFLFDSYPLSRKWSLGMVYCMTDNPGVNMGEGWGGNYGCDPVGGAVRKALNLHEVLGWTLTIARARVAFRFSFFLINE